MIESLSSIITSKNKLLNQTLIELRKSIFIEIIGSPRTNPKKWKMVSLGDTAHFHFETGKPIRKQNLDPNGEYRVYSTYGEIGRHSEYIFNNKLIVIGRVGAYCGNVYIAKEKSWVTSNAITLQLNESMFNIEFLAQMLTMLDLNNYASGNAQNYLSIKRIKNLSIYKPPLALQNEVSKYLIQAQKTEALIEERNNTIQKLNELK